jgi:hypothetical protein
VGEFQLKKDTREEKEEEKYKKAMNLQDKINRKDPIL